MSFSLFTSMSSECKVRERNRTLCEVTLEGSPSGSMVTQNAYNMSLFTGKRGKVTAPKKRKVYCRIYFNFRVFVL